MNNFIRIWFVICRSFFQKHCVSSLQKGVFGGPCLKIDMKESDFVINDLVVYVELIKQRIGET